MASQHGDPPARGRIRRGNLVLRADDDPPAIRLEKRGDMALGPAEDGDGPARGGVPQATGPSVQGADPPSVRAERQPLDGFVMPAQHRHFFSRARVPQTNGLVGGTGGKASAVGAVGQRGDGTFMPAQGADRRTGRHVPEVDGARISVHGGELLARRADGRQLPR